MNRLHLICTIGVVFSVFTSTNACKGCVNIDEYNFEKIVPRFEAVLVKFDVGYPYGEKHDIFAHIANEIVDNNNLILAQVGVKDYGEKENEAFAKKFGINSKNDLPALLLFVKGEDEPFMFDKKALWSDENLKRFVRDHTSIYLGLPGCLEQFDKLAMKFSATTDKEAVLKETEDAARAITGDREKSIANIYVKFMTKVLETSESFVKHESRRLQKLLDEGKINNKKKEELSHRLNVLKSFSSRPSKTEL